MEVETVIDMIERHCNNYFNPQNDPNDYYRDYPAGFRELAQRIMKFIENTPTTNIVSASFGIQSQTNDLAYNSWQKAFSAELAAYKRAKFI